MISKRLATTTAAAFLLVGLGAPSALALTESTETGELKLIDTQYGKALADSDGNALYVWEKDSAGTSACKDEKCVTAWPAALADDKPEADGAVTGALGHIDSVQPATKGKQQLTINDQPLYYFAKDAAAGDVKGHGLAPGGAGTTWYLVGADGKRLATKASTGGAGSDSGKDNGAGQTADKPKGGVDAGAEGATDNNTSLIAVGGGVAALGAAALGYSVMRRRSGSAA
ncbi:COG4315 family predicted lipoprotein [Streptomyces sp. NPDC001880]